MKIRWPRGKYNGRRITGVEITFKLNIFWWAFTVHKYSWSIHVGPFHLWVATAYESHHSDGAVMK